MHTDVQEILFTEEEVSAKVRELGEQITRDYQGQNLLVIGILKGAAMFMGDLVKRIGMLVEMDFMAVSSYGKSSESSGVVRIIKDLDKSIEDRHVLIVEDIIDTGLTLHYLKNLLQQRNAASVKVVSLLDKPERRKVEISPDYLGFSVPDHFIVGYGLDFAERYRNLPYIGVLKPEVYQS
ncbi:hypoxanthine phosphoribosyltransferase [Tumebacillus algifaecis]|uniref:Hypoxanthine phosphoribosyltransferase n=1 Tax=Tumebacillus algifaecis TaxID=1214604 RepID=A0A223CX95_9BACL|nr:hypoxanthine phosphoribosyltransferase [Tumebacillus algifaecis]ASS73807.1 hypoxanthine phosphoribosyltransferase [Tumebacillus algifaecis]